jgi:hypothetical protein
VNEWVDKYLQVKTIFCNRCEAECNKKRKLFCIEQFLYIVELWELSNDNNERS